MIMEWKNKLPKDELNSVNKIFDKYSSYVAAIKSVSTIEENSLGVAINIDDYIEIQKAYSHISKVAVEQEIMLIDLLDNEGQKEEITRRRTDLIRRHHEELSKNYFEKDFFDKSIDKLGLKNAGSDSEVTSEEKDSHSKEDTTVFENLSKNNNNFSDYDNNKKQSDEDAPYEF